VLLFIGTGIFTKDFSNMPLNVEILIAAAGLAAISPVSIIPYSFYPVLIGICGVVAILIGYPKFRQKDKGGKTVVISPD
jgi:Na+/H+ antiporter NhaC